jgi:ribosomal protein L31
MGKEGDVVRLDVDHLNHPAWNEGVTTVIERGQLSRFENKFSKFGSFGAKASDADKAS